MYPLVQFAQIIGWRQFPPVAQIFTLVLKLVNWLSAYRFVQLRIFLVIMIGIEIQPLEAPTTINPVRDMSLVPLIVPKFCWNTPIISTPPLKIIEVAPKFSNVVPYPTTNELEKIGDPCLIVEFPVPDNEIGAENGVDSTKTNWPVPVVVIAFVTTDRVANHSVPPCGTFILPTPFTDHPE
jgi:hypothetical protein